MRKPKILVLHKNRGSNAYSRSLQAHLKTTIEESKQKYYSRLSDKLLDSKTSPKSYWSILKTFLNIKKIPCFPPLLQNDELITGFNEKAELLNDFFIKLCSLVNNDSELPSVLTLKMCKSLLTVFDI